MAKTKFKPRRVRSEEDRNIGSANYIVLEEGKKFLGYALFEGNPADDEPGYYEFMEHWVPSAKRSVPCAGDDCPICEDGERPRVRAKTLWLVQQDESGNKLDPPEVRTFNFNSKIIKQFTELRAEDEKIYGRSFRISLVSDRGDYNVIPKAAKITKAEVKEALKDAPDFDDILTAALNKAMEGAAVARAMDDDDDDDDPPKAAKKKAGKAKSEPEPDDDDEPTGEWPEEGDEITVTVKKTNKQNTMTVTSEDYEDETVIWGTPDIDVTDYDKGTDLVVSYITDSEDDKVLTEEPTEAETEPEAEPEAEENDLPDKIEEDEFVVGEIDVANSTMDVSNDDLEFTLYFLDTMKELDLDDYEEGDKITVTAEKDTAGDMVATEIPEKVTKAKKKAGAKKGGTKKGAKGK